MTVYCVRETIKELSRILKFRQRTHLASLKCQQNLKTSKPFDPEWVQSAKVLDTQHSI
jgi:hypothetical protein